MAMKRPYLTDKMNGPVPEVTGDRFRPNDYIIDKRTINGKIGDAINLIVKTPSIVSGCNVSEGAPQTIDVSAGEVLIQNNLETSIVVHNYNATPIGTVTSPKYISYIPVPQYTNKPVSNLTMDGATRHYVKLSIDREMVLQRDRASDTIQYDTFVADAVKLVVDLETPTEDEILLATFTYLAGDSFSFFVANRSDATITKALNDTLAISNNDLYIEGGQKNKFSLNTTANRIYTFPDRDYRVGGVKDWVSSASYKKDDLVVEGGFLRRCLIDNTEAIFTANMWEIANGFFQSFTQVSPSFTVGAPVYFNGLVWQKAKANVESTVAIGIIAQKNGDDYVAQLGGELTLTDNEWKAIEENGNSLVGGTVYYTSQATAGAITSVKQSIVNSVIYAISTTKVIVTPFLNNWNRRVDWNTDVDNKPAGISLLGSIGMYLTPIAPTGVIYFHGTVVSRATYPELWDWVNNQAADLIDDTNAAKFGTGDGSTTFRMPDWRGLFVRGAGVSGTYKMQDNNYYNGGTIGTVVLDAVGDHNHYLRSVGLPGSSSNGYPWIDAPNTNNSVIGASKINQGRKAEETRPVAVAINWGISYE